ncbi:MAG: hypothetical protein ACTHXO_11295 [Actinomycetaceae bacterium]
MPSSDDPTDRPRTFRSFPLAQRIVAVAICVCVLLMVAAGVLGGMDEEWVPCEVVGAKGRQGDQYSASAFVVEIATVDCGTMIYSDGVSRDNHDDVAASFEPGHYEMRMGILSRLAARGWVPGLAASFEEFRAPGG